MRFLALLVLGLACVHGQTDLSKILAKGLDTAQATLTAVPEEDKKAILSETAAVLEKHLTFRPDGTAASVCTKLGKQHVEWKGLVVKYITNQPVTDADQLNGVTRRITVSFSCDAHRSFDPKTNRWGEWLNIGHVLFPSGISFEWRDGKWAAKAGTLDGFSPGPGPSITDKKPTNGDVTLPQGVTRGK